MARSLSSTEGEEASPFSFCMARAGFSGGEQSLSGASIPTGGGPGSTQLLPACCWDAQSHLSGVTAGTNAASARSHPGVGRVSTGLTGIYNGKLELFFPAEERRP